MLFEGSRGEQNPKQTIKGLHHSKEMERYQQNVELLIVTKWTHITYKNQKEGLHKQTDRRVSRNPEMVDHYLPWNPFK